MPEAARHIEDALAAGDPVAQPPADWLTTAQAAAALGKTDRTIRRMAHTGQLVAVPVRQPRGVAYYIDPACRPALAIAAGLDVAAALASDPLAGLSKAKRGQIADKLDVVRAFEAANSHRPADMPLAQWVPAWLDAYNLTRPGRKPVTRSTVYRWAQQFRDAGVAGLIDARRYSGGPAKWSAEARDLFDGLYLNQAKPKAAAIYEQLKAVGQAEGWDVPSLRSVRRYAAEVLDPKLKALGRDPKTYRDRCLPYVVRDWTKTPAMGCWIADHRLLDILLPRRVARKNAKTGRTAMVWTWERPWLTLFLDGRSWMPVAWTIQFDSPTGNRVMETFLRGVEQHGTPDAVYLDNGKDFRMYHFAGGRKRPGKVGESIVAEKAVKPVLDLLGIGVHFAKPYNAQAKPVEPFFGLVAERFDKTWPTYCGRSPEQRPERLKLAKMKRETADYYANGVTIEAVQQAFDRWVTDDYALRESPCKAAFDPATGERLSALRAFHSLRPAGYQTTRPSSDALAILLMVPSAPKRVEANGVYVREFGQHYMAQELEDRRCGSGRDLKRKVVVRHRTDKPDAVYVFDAQTDKFLCVATPYAGAGVDPLAAAGSDDADRLSAVMALKGRLAKTHKKALADAHLKAGNTLLAATQFSGNRLGLHDDPNTMPAAPPVRVVLHPQLDAAGQAATKHAATAKARRTAKQTAAEFFAATGTDDDEAPEATRHVPSALDLLAGAEADQEPLDETRPT